MFKRICVWVFVCVRDSVCVYSSDGDPQKGTAGVCVLFRCSLLRQRPWQHTATKQMLHTFNK